MSKINTNIGNILCIYHANCPDGFAAAWVVRKALGDRVVFFGGVHQKQPPDVMGMDVLIVDFSYKKEIVQKMLKTASSITILDHHISAKNDLQFLLDEGLVEGVFDINRSGAMITWEWFYPTEEAPKLIQHIQDRDLWRFQLTDTREITTGLASYPYDFDVWDKFMNYNSSELDSLKADGVAIERKLQKDILELISTGVRRMVIGGYNVPVLNVSSAYISDAGNLMSKDEPFAACYWDHADGRSFSLRSSVNGIDVSKVALLYGGGGHEKAAGFTISSGWVGE
ncbi:MAG: phosphohydrolase [Gammaproteobacteria bacterium]|nr:phosphohydrolase [Gammaproteobacteria bacterium]